MKRLYSVRTDQETQSSFPADSMYAARSKSGFKKRRLDTGGSMRLKKNYNTFRKSIPGIPSSNRCICPVVSGTGSNLATDIANTYSFDCNTGVFINGSASGSIGQLTQLIAVWDLMRVHKVEFTFIPQFNTQDIIATEGSVSNYAIPILYLAEDYSDDAAIGSLAEIQAYGNVKMYRFDKPVKHTLYPRLDGSNGVVDVGSNRLNQFIKAGTTSTQNFKGLKTYIDVAVGMDVCQYKCLMKIYYECAGSR